MVHTIERLVRLLLEYYHSPDMNAQPPKDVTNVGNGSMRMVFRYRNIVIKIPRGEEGISANHRENLVWNRSPSRIRRYLVPVVGMMGDVLIMEYVPPLQGVDEDDGEFIRFSSRIDKIIGRMVKRVSPEAFGSGDAHTGNMTNDGRLFDYAGF